jgi:hypothetical protein
MLYLIESSQTNLISKLDWNAEKWSEKLDGFKKRLAFTTVEEIIQQLKNTYSLDEIQAQKTTRVLSNSTHNNFRYAGSGSTFVLEPVYLEFHQLRGQLLYWKDYDFTFERVNDAYYLWCDANHEQREIKLSQQQIQQYKDKGFVFIDTLIRDLKKLNGSIEYAKAMQENRRVS